MGGHARPKPGVTGALYAKRRLPMNRVRVLISLAGLLLALVA